MDPKDVTTQLSLPPWVNELAEATRKTQEAAQAFKLQLENLNRTISKINESKAEAMTYEQYLASKDDC